MPAPHGIIERLAEMAVAGRPFVLVTLAAARGSVPQDTGTKMLVDATGLRYGTVGGGRVEHHAIEKARSLLADRSSGPCTLVEWNLKRDVGMTCGGTVTLLFETYHTHPWRVVVFGAGHVGQAVVRCLLLLDCHVVCVDSRKEWLARLPKQPQIEAVHLDAPQDYVARLTNDDFIVCMTMGHRTDLPVLAAIFGRGTSPRYLGAIGSRAKREVLVRDLAAAGVPHDQTAVLRCPVGLPLGGNQPGEIAVSVAAEILQVRDALRQAPGTVG